MITRTTPATADGPTTSFADEHAEQQRHHGDQVADDRGACGAHTTHEPAHQHERDPGPEHAHRGHRQERRPREPRSGDRDDTERRREHCADREDPRHHGKRSVLLLERGRDVERDPVAHGRDQDQRDAERLAGATAGGRECDRGHAEEADRDPDELPGPRRLPEQDRGDDGREDRRGAVQHAGDRRVDRALREREERERDRDPGDGQQQERPEVRSIDPRRGAPGRTHRTATPNRIRSHVTSPGRKVSSPIAMNRKEEPQIVPTTENSAQSTAANEPRCVPCAVDRIRVPIV